MPPRSRPRTTRALVVAVVASALVMAASGMNGASAADPETELAAARERLASLRSYFEDVAAQAQDAQRELDAITARFDAVELDVRALASDMVANEKNAVSFARELYMGGSTIALEGLLSSSSLADVDAQITYLQFSGERHSLLLEALAVRRDALERKLEQLATARSEADAVARRLADLRSDVEARLAELNAEVGALDAALTAELAATQQAALAAQGSVVTPGAPVPGPPYNADWDAIAMCESGGNWHLDGEYDGGLQFHPMTWLSHGGGKYAEYAWQATREQQIAIAEKVLASQGPGAWPHCFKELD